MLGTKLPVFCVLLVSFALTVNGGPLRVYGGLSLEQNIALRGRVIRLLTLKYYDRDLSTVSQEEALETFFGAFVKEAKAIEAETHVHLNIEELTAIDVEAEAQCRVAGITDPVQKQGVKYVMQMLMLKFHDRIDDANNPPTEDEMFAEVKHALDKEIKALQDIVSQAASSLMLF